MDTLRILTLCLCFVAAFVYGQVQPSNPAEPVSQTCLGCICEASSGCNTTLKCDGDVCGPFRITWGYWHDSGKPTFNNESPDSKQAFANCVNDAFCAARAVQGYMTKYGQDCNGDGKVDCDDYARIHRHGGYGCSAPLDPAYETPYKLCITTFG